ncbi:MAG: hypothetical protein NXI32_05995 [bacterium]|nr:hypothetical protein [bacterium]
MSNSSNPFQPSPDAQEQAHDRKSLLKLLPWPFSLLLATTLGVCYYRANLQSGGGEFFFSMVVFGAPLGMLLLSSMVMLRDTQAQKWSWQGVFVSAGFAVLISLAAFIAFATSCCFTNVMVGGFTLYPENIPDWTAGLTSSAFRGGLVTLAATLLGCWIVMLLQRLRAATRQRRNELVPQAEAEINI